MIPNESIYFALSLALIIPLGLLYYVPARNHIRYPIWIVIIMNICIYALSYFLVPPLILLANGHNVLVMLPVLGLMYVFLFLIGTLDFVRSMVFFLWATCLTSFASSFLQALVVSGFIELITLPALLIRLGIVVVILLLELILTHSWNPNFITDPNVPVSLWLSFLPVPVILFYQNTVLISYTPDMITSSMEFKAFMLTLIGNFVLFLILTSVFYSNATVYLEGARLSEEKRILEFQKAQYTSITKDVDNTNRLLHDFKHTLNALRTMAKEDGSDKILSYLDNVETLTGEKRIMNYCKHAPINSVLNHYAYRAETENVPLNLQVDLPETIPMEDFEICSLIGNLMENAIDACMVLPEKDRQFSLSIIMKDKSMFIVSSNSFDGKLKKRGGDYLSTKHTGHGIGIRSMRETVSLYGGEMKVHYEKKEFFVDILLTFV